MLLQDSIILKLSERNYKHYEYLGYSIKKKIGYGGKEVIDLPQSIEIKISDAFPSTRAKIKIQCDCCGTIFERELSQYLISKSKSDIDTCKKCSIQKTLDTKLQKYGTLNTNEISIQRGTKAGRNSKYSINDIIMFAENKGYKLRDDLCDTSIILVEHKYCFECNIHHNLFQSTLVSIMSDKTNCPECFSEKQSAIKRKSNIFQVEILCKEKDYMLLTDNIKNCDDEVKFICNKHKEYGVQTTTLWGLQHSKYNCRCCKVPKKENHWHWQGGITDIHEYLRTAIHPWKIDSFKYYNYQCDISHKSNSIIIHHIHNFSDIAKETFEICNLEIRHSIKEYSKEELEMLSRVCLELHYKYGYGVCLTEDIHNLFHKQYGKTNNTIEQYNEFKNNMLKLND